MAPQRVTGEQYYDLVGQLGEINRQLRQLNGYPFDLELLKKHLQDAIEGKFGNTSFQRGMWKTIKLGTHNISKLLEALEKANYKLGDKVGHTQYGINMHRFTFTVSVEETEINLVFVKVDELGFGNGAEL